MTMTNKLSDSTQQVNSLLEKSMKDIYKFSNVQTCEKSLKLDQMPQWLTKIRLKTKRFKSILENAIDGKGKKNRLLKPGKNTIDCLAGLNTFF